MISERLRQERLCLRCYAKNCFGEYFSFSLLRRAPVAVLLPWVQSQESFPSNSSSRQGKQSSPYLNHHHSLTSAFIPLSTQGLVHLVTEQEIGQKTSHRAKHQLRRTPSIKVPLRSSVLQALARPVPCPHHMQHPPCRDTWWGQEQETHPQYFASWPHSLPGQTFHDGMPKSEEN